MKNIRSVFHFWMALLIISGFFAIRVLASSPSQTGDVPEDEITIQSAPADAVLPDRINIPTEIFPVSRVRIEVSSADRLIVLQALGFACNQPGTCEVEADQAALTTLKENGFGYEILRQGVAVQIDPVTEAPDALVNWYGVNETDIAIPDLADQSCGYAYSMVTITGAPAGAIVQSVEYRIRVLHPFPSDLGLLISSGQTSEFIWEFLGGSDDGGLDDDAENDDDIYLNHRLINTAFDGQPVNQNWYLDANDCVGGDTGSIDYLELWIWYDGGAALPNLAPYSPPGWELPIVPSSISGTNTVNDLYAARPTYIDLAVINNGSAVPSEFDSCLFMDSMATPLECFYAGWLEINKYAILEDWVLNITPSVGWHSLRFEIDYNQAVAESNESDNVWRYDFYWNPDLGKIYLPFISTLKTFFEGPSELEPNNKYTLANGALISNRVYSGNSNDSDDYFYFTTTASGMIQVDLSGHTGQGVQMLLYYQTVDAGHVQQCIKVPGTTSCTINHNGEPGTYYVRIYTGLIPYTNETYSLQVIYP